MELHALGAIAFLVFYSNYMVAPLIPAFSTLFHGTLSDRFGRSPVLLILLPFASLKTLLIWFATTALGTKTQASKKWLSDWHVKCAVSEAAFRSKLTLRASPSKG